MSIIISFVVALCAAVILGGGVSLLVGFVRSATHKKTPEEDDKVRTKTYMMIVFWITFLYLIISNLTGGMR